MVRWKVEWDSAASSYSRHYEYVLVFVSTYMAKAKLTVAQEKRFIRAWSGFDETLSYTPLADVTRKHLADELALERERTIKQMRESLKQTVGTTIDVKDLLYKNLPPGVETE